MLWNERDRVFLYQVWRNTRARHGGDLYDIVGKVRAIDVRRGEATAGAGCETSITATRDLEALVAMMAGGAVRPPQAHPVAELRYWITFWLADGITLGRPYFAETRELMGGLALPPGVQRRARSLSGRTTMIVPGRSLGTPPDLLK